jgi:lactoylglutathione lyase
VAEILGDFETMHVERVKYLIWAADTERAVRFYETLFGAKITRQNPAVTDLDICGATIGIHSGGEGKRTWTGLSFQVADVVAGAAEVTAAGGILTHEPREENGEPPHLAMCADTEGNEFMLSRKRS